MGNPFPIRPGKKEQRKLNIQTRLQEAAEERGLTVHWAPITLPAESRTRYAQWIAAGRHATMGQLARAIDVRQDPTQRLAWARSVMLLSAPHAFPDPGVPVGGVRSGQVGRIFWFREQDYIRLLIEPHLEVLKALCYQLGGRCSDYIDQGPLPFRSYAALSGLGWIGRNGMLLNQSQGSYLTLAVLLTNQEIAAPPLYPNRCGTCQRCLQGCPTNALLGDGTLDAWRCTSYWTTQHRDLIPPERWEGLGDWVYGCDICQSVCPWNERAATFWQGYQPEPDLVHPDLTDFLTLSEQAFQQKYLGSSFERSGRIRMARNALIVLANTHDPSHLPLVRLAAQDINPLLRATAAHALARLGDRSTVANLQHDPSELVRKEAHSALASVA